MLPENNTQNRPSGIPICGIGASAGGIEALQRLFNTLPADLGLAYVVVVHLAPDRKSELSAIIARWTKMPVLQVAESQPEKLEPNRVYVIAPDQKLEITDSTVSSSPFDQPRGERTAIDLFFRSLADVHEDAFAVVLSGSGRDGALGARAVKQAGGLVLVQDPNEAAHKEMPGAVIATGAADIVLPVRELALKLVDLVLKKDQILPIVRATLETDHIAEGEERALNQVLELLRKRTGHDFSKYKRATILRRLARRMQISHQTSIANYLNHLRAENQETRALFNDFLISVTTFFRDPESWATLQKRVIQRLIEDAEPDEQIRVWVPGCATGEEAYTMGIVFREEFARQKIQPNFIIFASDVDEAALVGAREGLYPLSISADVTADRLDQYFRREGEQYRIARTLREHFVFATHNLLRDPPFSRLHLISCRNLLIYLNRELQAQTAQVFRYACRDQGYLFLGASEVIDEDLFQALDKKHRIFAVRRLGDARRAPPGILSAADARISGPAWEGRTAMKSTPAEIHASALEKVSPPSILVDQQWTVAHLSSSASRFFQQSGGALAKRATDLVRTELRDELHEILHRAFQDRAPQLSKFVSLSFDGAVHRVAMLARQHRRADDDRVDVLVTFLEAGVAQAIPAMPESGPSNELVGDLREKIRQADMRMETMRDDYNLTNEDLRAANEELQSLNEEYRSTTEELETSKEELQSINEELQTVNHELKLKLDEISHAHSDLENLMAATNVATLFLNTDLQIRRFTPQLVEIFNVRARDLDRPISDLTHTLDYEALEQDAQRVLAHLQPVEREIKSRNGKIFMARLSPYRRHGSTEIDGVVATFIDVTAIKQIEAALRKSERKLELELNVTRRMHRMTMEVATASNMQEALNAILHAAIELQKADFGNVQLLDKESEQLQIVAQHGLGAAYLRQFDHVSADDESSCGRALRSRRFVHIPDVMTDATYKYRQLAAESGYRSVQSIPLINRSGELVGVLSVHFRQPHEAAERDQQLSELLARQAADLIDSRSQQEKLMQLNAVLNKRTEELEVSERRLAQQTAELLEQDRHRQEFLAALGHELRNPMAAIQFSLTVMHASDEPTRRTLGIMRRQMTHMTRLVNDLLDIARISHGRLQLTRSVIDLKTGALEAVETVRQQAESKGLEIDCQLPPPDHDLRVDADPERLAQVFGNLLRNAITFTEKGKVTVAIRRDSTDAHVTVSDTGIGIDPKSAAAIFKPYDQGDATSKRSGLGLGLTVAKGVIEAHGGTISFRSDGAGKGSDFTFTIPLVQAAPPPRDFTETPISSPERRRILVVDDQTDVADALGAVIQQLGQDVRVSYSGEDALAAADEQRPHAAFVDLSMPHMDGGELASRLRRKFRDGGITLVAISGRADAEKIARKEAFDHYLLKPVSAEVIAQLLNSLPLAT